MLKIISILLIKTWSPASGLVRQTPVYFGQYWDIGGDINNILAFYCNIPWTHTNSKQSRAGTSYQCHCVTCTLGDAKK